jgi:SAM-dependent methyltransferase
MIWFLGSVTAVAITGGFDEGCRRWRASRVYLGLMGEGFPAPIQPFSFVPWDGLNALAARLMVAPGQTVVGLGCGRGGPGLWLATCAGARLIGIDASAVAVADARVRRRLFPDLVDARFRVGDVANTGLPDGCADAVVALDVLQLLAEPTGMLAEVTRLLRPQGRLALTTWEGFGDAPARFPRDLPAFIERAGLRVDHCTERPAWLQRQLRIYQHAAELAVESAGDPAICDLADEGRRWRAWHHHLRRVVISAHRPEQRIRLPHSEACSLRPTVAPAVGSLIEPPK